MYEFQLQASLAVLVLRNGSDVPGSEISILVVGVLLSVLLLVLGYVTVDILFSVNAEILFGLSLIDF